MLLLIAYLLLVSCLLSVAAFAAEEALARGLVDATVEAGQLLDRAVAEAEAFAALPTTTFQLTKQQLREEALKRMREEGARFDSRVQELWARPESLAAIQAYVTRTFKRAEKEPPAR